MDNKDAGVVSGAPSSTSASVLGGGRPVMGLRQHNQTRKTRILSSQTPLAPGSSWLQQRRNSTTVANAAPAQQQQVSQPMSELSLHFDGGAGSATDNHERLTKSPSCDDRIRKVSRWLLLSREKLLVVFTPTCAFAWRNNPKSAMKVVCPYKWWICGFGDGSLIVRWARGRTGFDSRLVSQPPAAGTIAPVCWLPTEWRLKQPLFPQISHGFHH